MVQIPNRLRNPNFNMKLKTLSLISILTILLAMSEVGIAQEINGLVKSKSSTIYFEGFGSDKLSFDGEIHSNLTGSTYKVDLKNGTDELEGEISDKFSKFTVDLDYKNQQIEGTIKRSPNGTKDEWDIDFFDQNLSGTVTHNAMKTVDTYKLSYGNQELSGTIGKKMGTLAYDLSLGNKKIGGSMAYGVSTTKHSYNLKAENLSEDEFMLLLFVETIKLLNEQIDDIDEFQGNN